MKCINLGLQRNAVFAYRAFLRLLLSSTLLVLLPCTTLSLPFQTRDRSSPSKTTTSSWKELAAEAEVLRSRWTAGSWREALQKYQAVLLKLRRARLPREEAQVLRSLGLVHLALGDSKQALQHLTLSLDRLNRLNAEDNELVDTLNDLANAHLLIGNNEEALKLCNKSLNLSRSLGYLRGEGWAVELTGQIEYASGKLSASLDWYTKALSLLTKANDSAGIAQTFLDLGYSYSDLFETENATRFLDQALVLWRAIKNPRGEALTLTALGHLRTKLGDKQRALDLYYQSIELLEPLEDRIAMAYNFDGLGYTHSGLGETSTALSDYTKTYQLFSEAKYRYGETGALSNIAEIHIANEDYRTAFNYLNRALTVARSVGDPRMEAVPIALIAQVHERQKRFPQALDVYKQALTLNRRGKDNREEAYTLNSIGRVQETLGLNQEALDNYTQALTLNRATRDRFGESGTVYRIAKVQQTMGRLKEAKSNAEQSIALVESLRAGVASHHLRSSYVATVHQLYELYIDILMSLHKLEPAAGFASAALEASEAGRARTLLETLAEAKAQIREGVDPKLLEREHTLQLRLEALATGQVSSLPTATEKEKLELEAEIERVTSEFRNVQGQIRAASPQYAALVQPETLKVKQIQEMLEPGTLLLEYSLGERRSFVWAITSGTTASYELPAQASIEELAQRLYASIIASADPAQATPSYESDARSISSMLLRPVNELSQAKRLVIVADGVLQYISFGALPNPANTSPNLVSDYEIVRLHSASVLAMQRAQFAQRTPRPKSVAVIADPVFNNLDPRVAALRISRASGSQRAGRYSTGAGNSRSVSYSRALRGIDNGRYERLVFSLEEAEAVYAASSPVDSLRAIGFKASRATATSPELSQYKIIHIAAHGVLNSKHPELSGILLSRIDENGKPIDGFLQLHEIYNLKLPAELVVLSACETGIGKQIRGEGLIALTRGFMYAGAARVVASLWKVDDSATAVLMGHFYREMFKNGRRPAEALKEAQIALSKERRWRKPYYWAGFVLTGEWR